MNPYELLQHAQNLNNNRNVALGHVRDAQLKANGTYGPFPEGFNITSSYQNELNEFNNADRVLKDFINKHNMILNNGQVSYNMDELHQQAMLENRVFDSKKNRLTPEQVQAKKEKIRARREARKNPTPPQTYEEYVKSEEARKAAGAIKDARLNDPSFAVNSDQLTNKVKQNFVDDHLEKIKKNMNFSVENRAKAIVEHGINGVKYTEEQAKRIAFAEKQISDVSHQIGLSKENRIIDLEESANNFKDTYMQMTGSEMRHINSEVDTTLKDRIKSIFEDSRASSEEKAIKYLDSRIEAGFRNAVSNVTDVRLNPENLMNYDKVMPMYEAKLEEIYNDFGALDVNGNVNRLIEKEKVTQARAIGNHRKRTEEYFTKNAAKKGDVLGQVINALDDTTKNSEGLNSLLSTIKETSLSEPIHLNGKELENLIQRSYRGGSVDDFINKISNNVTLSDDSLDILRFLFKDNQDPNKISSKVTSLMEKGEKLDKKEAKRILADMSYVPNSRGIIDKKAEKKMAKEAKRELRQFMDKTGANDVTLSAAVRSAKPTALINTTFSALFAVGDFKEARKEGKTVLGSAADAALGFVEGELLGPMGLLIKGGASLVGTAATKGVTELQKLSRSMNNTQKFSPFDDMQFHDTQQLATMRQSGMELAKMANYNLQQTLMGAEAKYLHR